MLLLVIYAKSVAAEVPADLLNGPLVEGAPFPVALGDESQTGGELVGRKADGTQVVAIGGKLWELVPRAPKAMAPTRPDSRHNFERFVIREHSGELGEEARRPPSGGRRNEDPGSQGRQRTASPSVGIPALRQRAVQ